ncbi:MAG: thiolase family protein, partial [Pseudomonadota bacterium]|nr:thiolase family protein [Pseudomonadota bacterium]
LEDIGVCGKGEGGAFVGETDLTWRGPCPVNTHGGQLSFGQPGLAGGATQMIEGIRQLMGRGGERQVKDAVIGYVGNGGVIGQASSVVLSNDATA